MKVLNFNIKNSDNKKLNLTCVRNLGSMKDIMDFASVNELFIPSDEHLPLILHNINSVMVSLECSPVAILYKDLFSSILNEVFITNTKLSKGSEMAVYQGFSIFGGKNEYSVLRTKCLGRVKNSVLLLDMNDSEVSEFFKEV